MTITNKEFFDKYTSKGVTAKVLGVYSMFTNEVLYVVVVVPATFDNAITVERTNIHHAAPLLKNYIPIVGDVVDLVFKLGPVTANSLLSIVERDTHL